MWRSLVRRRSEAATSTFPVASSSGGGASTCGACVGRRAAHATPTAANAPHGRGTGSLLASPLGPVLAPGTGSTPGGFRGFASKAGKLITPPMQPTTKPRAAKKAQAVDNAAPGAAPAGAKWSKSGTSMNKGRELSAVVATAAPERACASVARLPADASSSSSLTEAAPEAAPDAFDGPKASDYSRQSPREHVLLRPHM